MLMIDPPHLVTTDLTHCTVIGRRGGVENSSEYTFFSPLRRSSNSLIRKDRGRQTAPALLKLDGRSRGGRERRAAAAGKDEQPATSSSIA